MRNYTESFIKTILENIDWLLEKNGLSTIIFCKICRLLSYYITVNTNPIMKQNLLKIAESIWNKRKTDCFTMGRGLIRLFQSLFKSSDLDFVNQDFAKSFSSSKIPLFTELLRNNYGQSTFEHLRVNIPPFLEFMLQHLLHKVPAENCSRFMRWIQKEFQIQPNSFSEFLFADMIVYIIDVIHPTVDIINSPLTQRWHVLNWMLDNIQTEIVKALAKQNIFFDWIHFDPKKDSIMLLEPGCLLIKNTFFTNPNMAQELLEFILLLAEQQVISLIDFLFKDLFSYNPHNVSEAKNCVKSAFDECVKKRVISSFYEIFPSNMLEPLLQDKLSKFLNFDISTLYVESPIASPIEEPSTWRKGSDVIDFKSPELIHIDIDENEKRKELNSSKKINENKTNDSLNNNQTESSYSNLLEEYNPEQVILLDEVSTPSASSILTINIGQKSEENTQQVDKIDKPDNIEIEQIKPSLSLMEVEELIAPKQQSMDTLSHLGLRESFCELYGKELEELIKKADLNNYEMFFKVT